MEQYWNKTVLINIIILLISQYFAHLLRFALFANLQTPNMLNFTFNYDLFLHQNGYHNPLPDFSAIIYYEASMFLTPLLIKPSFIKWGEGAWNHHTMPKICHRLYHAYFFIFFCPCTLHWSMLLSLYRTYCITNKLQKGGLTCHKAP